jgi:4-hydroxy-tetrahydrodipicolinate reductase
LVGCDPTGILIDDNMEELFKASDAVIDFSLPDVTMNCAELAAKHKKIFISGTTGLSQEQLAALLAFAGRTTIVWSANMSLGVNLLAQLARTAAEILDNNYDVEIVDIHHGNKIDAPSGTSLMLGNTVADARNIDAEDNFTFDRTRVRTKREKGKIGFSSIRGGDVAAEVTTMFLGQGERLELTHKASNRSIFATGAVKAAVWARGKGPGFYSMQDVLFSK